MSSWSKEETEFIIKNYPSKGRNYCAESLGKTVGSVASKARRHGLFSTVTRANSKAEQYSSWLDTYRPEIIALGEYTLSSKSILHKSLVCEHSWLATPNNIKRGSGCPECAHNKPLDTETYKRKIVDSEFELLEDYIPNDTKLLHRHKVCGHEWNVRPRDIVKGQNCPKCSRRNYSSVAIEWLNSLENPNILHAENGGEKLVAGYKVDGYDPVTNTVYEFHGDVFHGNLEVYSPEYKCHPFDKTVTAEDLFEATFEKMNNISEVATVIYIWEKDYRAGKSYEYFT